MAKKSKSSKKHRILNPAGKKSSKKATGAERKADKKTTPRKITPRKTVPQKRSATSSKTKTHQTEEPATKQSLHKTAKKTMRPTHSPATSMDPIQFSDAPPKLPKTYLTAKQLREFKDLLLLKRTELNGDVRYLTNDAFGRQNNSSDRAVMPIHMADVGTDNWEQEFTLGLIANEHKRLREIEDALQRIENKTYGVCLATQKKISLGRLRAKPWAKYCIEYARLREEGRAP